jgi:hypothetical protein
VSGLPNNDTKIDWVHCTCSCVVNLEKVCTQLNSFSPCCTVHDDPPFFPPFYPNWTILFSLLDFVLSVVINFSLDKSTSSHCSYSMSNTNLDSPSGQSELSPVFLNRFTREHFLAFSLNPDFLMGFMKICTFLLHNVYLGNIPRKFIHLGIHFFEKKPIWTCPPQFSTLLHEVWEQCQQLHGLSCHGSLLKFSQQFGVQLLPPPKKFPGYVVRPRKVHKYFRIKSSSSQTTSCPGQCVDDGVIRLFAKYWKDCGRLVDSGRFHTFDP